ncbi:MAG: DUF1036 domain-containing protein [Pseudomonadota bacterium]
MKAAARLTLKRFSAPSLPLLWMVPLLLFQVPLTTTPAHADLKVCNDTQTLVGVAVGYRRQGTWVSEGWWRVPKDKCVSVIEGDLNARYYYIHAEDSKTGGRWQGPVFMCTSNKEFKIDGLKNCFSRGFERAGFFEVDTDAQKNWQIRLTENNATKKEATNP